MFSRGALLLIAWHGGGRSRVIGTDYEVATTDWLVDDGKPQTATYQSLIEAKFDV